MNAKTWTAALAAALVLPLAAPSAVAEEDPATSVVLHLGHYTDDLHAASMGLSLARLLQKEGARVTLFLDREGVRLADARGPEGMRWGAKAESIQEIYAGFVEAGGAVLLCGHCASAAGVDAAHLHAGARIAKNAEVAKLFLTADRVIDY